MFETVLSGTVFGLSRSSPPPTTHVIGRCCRGSLLETGSQESVATRFPTWHQKNPNVRSFSACGSRAEYGCANFMGAWDFCSFCRRTSMSIKFLVFGGGGYFVFFFGGGGSANYIFMGARIFLITVKTWGERSDSQTCYRTMFWASRALSSHACVSWNQTKTSTGSQNTFWDSVASYRRDPVSRVARQAPPKTTHHPNKRHTPLPMVFFRGGEPFLFLFWEGKKGIGGAKAWCRPLFRILS